MKYCVIILDGAAGWPLSGLGDRTTLQAAATPNLDALAREGTVGLARTIAPGTEASSAAACTSILGYDPIANRIGRGAIEAASMGITLKPGQVALRMNLVNIEDGVMKSYSSGHITTAESRAIAEDLGRGLNDMTFHFHPGVSYRHILVVNGRPELMDAVFTPPHDISDKPVAGHLPHGPGTEHLHYLMQKARPVLAASPTNHARIERGELEATDIWPFWPGVAPEGMRPFSAMREVSAAMTSGVDLLNGLAVLSGIDRIDIPGVTDGSDNDYAGQAKGALAALNDHDLVVIHVESPDEEGHSGDVAGKIAAIEAIDREVVGRVREAAEKSAGGMRILAMPDHPTPVAIKTHTDEPVPFVLAGPGIGGPTAEAFSEAEAAGTGVVLEPGHRVMDLLLG